LEKARTRKRKDAETLMADMYREQEEERQRRELLWKRRDKAARGRLEWWEGEQRKTLEQHRDRQQHWEERQNTNMAAIQELRKRQQERQTQQQERQERWEKQQGQKLEAIQEMLAQLLSNERPAHGPTPPRPSVGTPHLERLLSQGHVERAASPFAYPDSPRPERNCEERATGSTATQQPNEEHGGEKSGRKNQKKYIGC